MEYSTASSTEPTDQVINIIQLQTAEDAAVNPLSKKKIKVVKKQSAAKATATTTTAANDAIATTATATSANAAIATTATATSANAAIATTATATPAFIESDPTTRKTFIKYTLTLPSASCISYLFAHMAKFYPVEMFQYINSFKYRLENKKKSACVCTFQSHLEYEHLVQILTTLPENQLVSDAVRNTLRAQVSNKHK